jgi:hypothetical protein
VSRILKDPSVWEMITQESAENSYSEPHPAIVDGLA